MANVTANDLPRGAWPQIVDAIASLADSTS
jgi:hypothetical protein